MESDNINIKNFEVKARSKKEVQTLIKLESNVYLPPDTQANCDYISDIITGEKNVSKQITYLLVYNRKAGQPHRCSSY
jgi:hypothetical protein